MMDPNSRERKQEFSRTDSVVAVGIGTGNLYSDEGQLGTDSRLNVYSV